MTGDNKKILIIEDALTYQQGLKREFVQSGYEVRCVGTGEDGLREVKKFKPDIIVLDLVLPGIGGREVCRQLKMDINYRHIPVMILTMKTEDKYVEEGLESGADSYVSKNESMNLIVKRAEALFKLSAVVKPLFEEGGAAEEEEELKLADKIILLVDDDITFLHIMKRRLQEAGYKLITAMSGQECFERLKEEVPDILLLDLRMPEIDGIDVCRQVRKIKRFVSLPIVMLTASDSQEDITRSFEAGVNDFVVKSADLKVINLRIHSILRRRHYEQEARRIQLKLSDAEMKSIVANAEKEAEKKNAAELERKNAQLDYLNKELQELDRLKTEFISTVSHELRTPLVAIGGLVTNILMGVTGKVEGRLREYLVLADGDIKRLDRLIMNLLDFSRIEKGKLNLEKRTTDICALARRVADMLKTQIEAKRIVLSTDFAQKEILVYMDADKIIQVLTNLLHNAIKFTPDGGTISLDISSRPQEKLLRVAVIDSGIGIPKDKIDSLFQRFVQVGRKAGGAGPQGTGLGLAISKGIVESHKGKIWVESEINKGSSFIFTLPLLDDEEILTDALDDNLRAVREEKTALSLIIIDVDQTDEVEKIAQETTRHRRDSVIRYKGNKIAIALYGSARKDAEAFIGRLKELIPETIKPVFGIAAFPDEASSAKELIEKASSHNA